jgi:hypothetical protein
MQVEIKDFYGRVIGRIETLQNGDKVVKDFYGKTLGYYRKNYDVTTDFYGRTIARGEACSMLLNK